MSSVLYLSCKAHYTSEERGGSVRNRIAELRRERRVTQEELGEAVGVTRQTIISLENGRYNASLLLAHRLAQYFHLTIEELFVFEEDET